MLVKMKIRAFCYRCEGWGLCFELISFQGGMRKAVRGYGIEEFPFFFFFLAVEVPKQSPARVFGTFVFWWR